MLFRSLQDCNSCSGNFHLINEPNYLSQWYSSSNDYSSLAEKQICKQNTVIFGYKAHPTSAIRSEISIVIRSALMNFLFFWVVSDEFDLKPSIWP